MKIRKINWFFKLFVTGITLAPFGIYVMEYHMNNERVINQEKIHWKQQMEMLILFFYIWYFIEWFIRLFTNTKNAYYSISFEREAYDNQQNQDYLKIRKPYSWFKYIFKK